MPNYRYKVRDKYGKLSSGVIRGSDKGSVAKHLNAMGYVPISIDETADTDSGIMKLPQFFKRVTPQELNLFTRQLVTMQRSGVPLLTSLNILEKQTTNKYFKDIIKEISASIEGGMSLSDALAKHPAVFGELYTSMVRAGEASGLLDEILMRLTEFGEKEIEYRNKIKSATRYPMITLGALVCAFLVVVNFVIPKFAGIFAQFKTNLPLPTKILLGLNYSMKHYFILMILGIVVFVYLVTKYINTKDGRLRWDTFKLDMPIFGKLTMMFVMERFARTMSILIRSGLPILQALDMAARAVGNALVARTISAIASNVREGKSIAEPMGISGLFPPIVVQMVAIGEDTGKLDELLMKVSEYYEQQSDYMLKNLTTLIEPLFILILGAMVLTMALAVFLPVWSLMSVFKH